MKMILDIKEQKRKNDTQSLKERMMLNIVASTGGQL